jgi:phosphoenolpyruvate carboxykinase (ATP)
MSLISEITEIKVTHQLNGWTERPPKEYLRERTDAYADKSVPPREDILPVIHKNSPRHFLIEKTLAFRQGELGPHGELIIMTGSHTGRAADDKYVVQCPHTEKNVWWENNVKPMGDESFERLQKDVMAYLQTREEIFFTNRSIGKSNHYALNIEFISEMPSAALFTQYMFKNTQGNAHENFKILHVPFFEVDPFKYGTRSDTVIATCFERKCIIIAGTQYAGEIKKSAFSAMNYLAPENGILPMHAGANMNAAGESFIFFGLSGTGKTTLSTDTEVQLIGDDEHGLSERGLFNFEGGCYAKTLGLSAATEPDIYKASTRFGSFLENVKKDFDTGEIDFFDSTITENGRSSYPLEFVEKRVPTGEARPPRDIFFLSADAFGVLPPVSQLTFQQALDFFLLGYTAKLAGTENGVKNPRAAFSPCFGAPFMLRHPTEYMELLAKYIKQHDMRVWLINTGWTGGPFGIGERFPLAITRDIVRAIQNHELDNMAFEEDPIFGLRIPQAVRGISAKVLNPQQAWPSAAEYVKAATLLKESFVQELAKLRN